MIRQETYPDGTSKETLVSPEDIATALAAKVEHFYISDILLPNTLCAGQSGARRFIVEWRPPQKMGIWLEGIQDPIRIPMPAFILVRYTSGSQHSYRLWAVRDTQRPTSLDIDLFESPLPNSSRGGVCWGTVVHTPEGTHPNDLSPTWDQLFGSRFGNHSAPDKSVKFKDDIRKLYFELEQSDTDTYPLDDLVPDTINGTLRKALTGKANLW